MSEADLEFVATNAGTKMKNPQTVTLALTGASGMPYGIRLLEMLVAEGKQVYLLYSQVAQIVAQQEMNLALDEAIAASCI